MAFLLQVIRPRRWVGIIIDFANFQTSRGDVSPSWFSALTELKQTYFVNYPAMSNLSKLYGKTMGY